LKVVHYPLASPNVTSFNVDVGASATPSFFFSRNLTLPTKWLAGIFAYSLLLMCAIMQIAAEEFVAGMAPNYIKTI
jgi:hypothetical protein